MIFSVCISCGASKAEPSCQCPICHFHPKSAEEKAKSVILSLDYEIEDEYRGKTKQELLAIGLQISKGVAYDFDQAEVRSVMMYADRALGVTRKQLTVDALRWLLLPIALLILAYITLA